MTLFVGNIALLAVLMLAPLGTAWAAAIGEVVTLKGSGVIMRADAHSPLAVGANVHAQDIIHTQKGGIAEIRFEDESIITVGSESQIIIDQFVYDAEAPANNQSSLRVGKGFFHFVSGKLSREKVKIHTPVSTIGIRGTELAGEVRANGWSMVSLVDCCVDVTNESGAISLERVGMCTEISSRREAPEKPILTPDWWADRAVAALGKSRTDLGLSMLEASFDDSAKTDAGFTSKQYEALDEPIKPELGPKNRVSFPFYNGE
jgi:hypothetical protein